MRPPKPAPVAPVEMKPPSYGVLRLDAHGSDSAQCEIDARRQSIEFFGAGRDIAMLLISAEAEFDLVNGWTEPGSKSIGWKADYRAWLR